MLRFATERGARKQTAVDDTNYRVIRTGEDLRKAVELLSIHQVIGLDTETTELDPYYAGRVLFNQPRPRLYIITLDEFRKSD